MGIPISFLFGVILTVAYTFTSLSGKEMEKMHSACVKNEGVSRVLIFTLGAASVTCKDGAKFSIKGE